MTGALTEQCRESYRPLLYALSALLCASEAAGTVVPGTCADDVLLPLGPLCHVGARDEDRARAGRLLDVLMRGVCPSAAARDATDSRTARHAR